MAKRTRQVEEDPGEYVSPGRAALMEHRDKLLGKLPTLDLIDGDSARRKVLADLLLAEAALEGGKTLIEGLKGLGMLESLASSIESSVTPRRRGSKVKSDQTIESLMGAIDL